MTEIVHTFNEATGERSARPTASLTKSVETSLASLAKAMDDKASSADLTSLATVVGGKAASSDLSGLATIVSNNKIALDASISSAIADWVADRYYRAGNKVMRGRTFFICIKDNQGQDPNTDTVGNWSIFTPGSENDVFANRSPTQADVSAIGVKWWDVSFGADSPLGFVSLGKGAWQYTNQITLSRVRFFCNGVNNTYRSKLTSIRFIKPDGTQIPNNWWVWGGGTIGGQQSGTSYAGQEIGCGYNSSGWRDLEPSSLFNTNTSIARIIGNMAYLACSGVQLHFSNGGVKTYSSVGTVVTPSDQNLATFDPAIPCRYGDSVSAALGEILTAAKLTDANSNDPGRVTGAAFVSAFNELFMAQPTVLAAYQQETIDALTARIAALEIKL